MNPGSSQWRRSNKRMEREREREREERMFVAVKLHVVICLRSRHWPNLNWPQNSTLKYGF
jgi:hypothetical protein